MEYTNDILTQAGEMLNVDTGSENGAALEAMCRAAGSELEARLREGVSVEDIKELFVSAAGVLALSMYIQLGGAGDVAAFKAGNISVTKRGSGDVRVSAAALRGQAEGMLSDYLKDRGFDFRGVRG